MEYLGYAVDPLTQGMAGLKLQARAGDSVLMSAFTHGNVIQLQSQSTGRNLRVIDGAVNGNGGLGKHAQFIVHVRRPGVVALQNSHDPSRWLAVFDGRTVGTGQGGPYCDLMIGEIEGRHVVLESCQHPGQRIGILPDGSTKKAFDTGTGLHGRFIPIVQEYAQCPQGIPPTHYGQPPTFEAPRITLSSLFTEGNVIILSALSTGKNLRITKQGAVEGLGGAGVWAQFIVHVRSSGVVALQNVGNPSHWLAIEGGLTKAGNGDGCSEFYVKEIGGGQYIVLESVVYPGQHIGLFPNGQAKPPHETGTGERARFIPRLPPKGSHKAAMAHPQMQQAPYTSLSAGTTPILSIFTEGNVIFLHSVSSGKNLRITGQGVVEGVGGAGVWAQFIVHVRRHPGVVALQNVGNRSHWLCVDGGITRAGDGGRCCEFHVKEIQNQFVVLESVVYAGHHIGILPNGQCKLPESTRTGPAARFISQIVSQNPQPPMVAIGHASPPVYPNPTVSVHSQPTAPVGYPQATVSPYPAQPAVSPYPPQPAVSPYPPQPVVSPYPPQPVVSPYPPQPAVSPYPPQPAVSSYPPQVTTVSPYPPQPVGAVHNHPPLQFTPVGVVGAAQPLLSVFQQGQKVRLKSKATGRNLRIRNGNVDGNGGDGEFATFIVHVRAEGVVSLQSVPDPSRWLRITAEGILDGKGSGHQWTEFRVKPIGSDVVCLESVVFPEWHVGILPTGEPKLGKHTHTGQHGQFYPYKP